MKHTIEMFVHVSEDFEGNKKYTLFPFDMQTAGYLLVCKVPVEYETPDDFNMTAAEIAALEKERESVNKEYGQKLKSIDTRISKLQAIEFAG